MSKCFHHWSVYVLVAALCVLRVSAQEAEPVDNEPQPAETLTGPKPDLIKQEPKLDLNPVITQPQPESNPPGKHLSLFGGVVEKDLAIEWDNWHNKLVHAALPRVFNNFAEALNVPNGTTTWIHCEVTREKHIKSALVTKSSGLLWFDRMARDAVYRLEGNSVLTFPANSQRTDVATDFTVSKGGKHTGDLVFGDIEYTEGTPEERTKSP